MFPRFRPIPRDGTAAFGSIASNEQARTIIGNKGPLAQDLPLLVGRITELPATLSSLSGPNNATADDARAFGDTVQRTYDLSATTTRVEGKTLVATVKASDLGSRPVKGWGWQVLMQSNEGYPDKGDLLTRKVNEIGGQHRFGGGSDYNCDPHVIDMIVAPGKGGADEVRMQHTALKYECNASNPEASPLVELPMVYP